MNNLSLSILCFIFVGLIGLSIFALWNFYDRLVNKIIIFKLKKKIQNDPFIGSPDIDNTYLYEEKGYHIRYKVVTSETVEKRLIEWILIKYKLKPSEMAIKNMEKIFANFWHNGDWLCLFHPSLIILLLLGIVIFYFALVETQESKIDRFRWIVSRRLGVDPAQIEYVGGGWVNIFGNRKTAVEGREEPITYTVSPLRWLFSGDIGYITRWKGIHGYDTNRLSFDRARNIWLKKEGEWQQGRVTENKVEWEEPQGTGIREGKIFGHEISIEDKKLYILDR